MVHIKKFKKVLKDGTLKTYEYSSDKYNWQKTRPDIRYDCPCGKKNVSLWRRKSHEKSKFHSKGIRCYYINSKQ